MTAAQEVGTSLPVRFLTVLTTHMFIHHHIELIPFDVLLTCRNTHGPGSKLSKLTESTGLTIQSKHLCNTDNKVNLSSLSSLT